ncbi:MAG TPA: hypothetical protein VHU41_05320 [Thermoanaerobaculia bacterium]|jgi:hypothetical protein|nr:hypothetical protein [Thermoanaerobaculia bacterium]
MSETRPAVLLGGGIAILAIFLSRFRPAWLLLIETAQPALVAAAIVLAMLATGAGALWLAQRFFRVEREVPLLDAVIVGFPTFGTLIGIVAWAGLAMHAIIAAITFVLAGAGAFLLMRRRICAPRIPLLLVIPLLIAVVEAITPVNSPDELVYKLAVTHAYDMAGRMFEMPLNSHSYLAMGLQLADLAALVLSGGIAAKLVHLGLYFAALAAIRRLTKSVPITAIVAWAPVLMVIAGWAWSEWGVIALLVLSVDRFDDHPAIAFAALGGAAASKYTALPWLLAFAIVMLVRSRNGKLLLRGALVVALFGGFFYVRNTVWSGSPLAPLFLPDAPQLYGYEGGGAFSGWRELLSGSFIVDPRMIDESLGVTLPLAAICGLFALASPSRKHRSLAWIGAIQMPILITMAPIARNTINGVVPLALAGGGIIEAIWMAARPWMRKLLGTVVGLAFAAQLALAVFVIESYDIVPYLAGKETARGYVSRVRDFAPVYQWIEGNTAPSAKVLILGENRTYDLDRQTIAGGNLDGPRIAAWLARFPNVVMLRAELTRLHVTHVLVHPAWMRAPKTMMEREFMLDLPPQTDARLRDFLGTGASLVYRDKSYLLFAIR